MLRSEYLVAHLHKTYDLAVAYNDDRWANLRVLHWLRHKTYNDVRWDKLIGAVDEQWIKWADGRYLETLETFQTRILSILASRRIIWAQVGMEYTTWVIIPTATLLVGRV